MSVAASDSLNHTLGYAWSASCAAALGSNGSFANGTTATPTWTAPANGTGSAQTCAIQVTVDDGAGGLSQSASFNQTVNAAGDSITITSGPTAAPAALASGGTTFLSVAAQDALGHPLTYAWSAVCPGLPDTGVFAYSGGPTAPTWTSPANTTGAQVSCTLSVTVSDSFGTSASKNVTVTVEPTEPSGDTVTITAGPNAAPSVLSSGGTTFLSVSATDSLGHALTYAWSAVCPGLPDNGLFAFSGGPTAPTWRAPENGTGAQRTCTITVNVADQFGHSASRTVDVSVLPSQHTLTITQQPSGNPNPVASGGAVNMSVAASDSQSHTLGYAWSASCAAALGGNGSFANGTTATPTWTAPANLTGSAQTCAIQVTVNDGAGGLTQSASFTRPSTRSATR